MFNGIKGKLIENLETQLLLQLYICFFIFSICSDENITPLEKTTKQNKFKLVRFRKSYI